MSSRLGWFILGGSVTLAALCLAGYLFVRSGGVSMATTAKPLPFEVVVARLALHASFKKDASLKNPLPFNDANMIAGAQQFKERCAFCHGLPGQKPTDAALGMFPKPPQFFEGNAMVTSDPEGVTYWKVTHGIRLSGMPGFASTLSDNERWQITMLVAHANSLPPAVLNQLTH